MKLYQAPAIDVIRLFSQDVLTASIDNVGDVELPDDFFDGGDILLPDEGL